MKIVIDIPEILFEKIQNRKADKRTLETVIMCGTPLPKGHGKLIDADELKKIIKENDILTMAGFSIRLYDIDNTPTIIEADKENEEEQCGK